jgi:hypothetical protein
VVTEDFPAPPFPAWTRSIAARIEAPVWAVDCACIVPMRLQPRRFERAFELRRHNQQAYAERVPRPWPETDLTPAPYQGPLPFNPWTIGPPTSPRSAPPATSTTAAAGAAHAGGSMPAMPAGSASSATGSRAITAAQRCRRAWPRGVSRLSAYLHHGQVSPFRIAREAHAVGGEGAEKFLDELLIWRELAHNFCFHTHDPEAWAALPDWARETLTAHADDPRERCIDHERLARGAPATGSGTWRSARCWSMANCTTTCA